MARSSTGTAAHAAIALAVNEDAFAAVDSGPRCGGKLVRRPVHRLAA
ncbi:hypothetical protein ABZT06_20590 [Streptomyces sp. NPDC005483]